MIGMPFKASSCLGRSAFMRRPKPAAAMIAPTFIRRERILMRNFRLRLPFRCTFGPRIGMAVPFRTIFARWMMRHFGALFLVSAEDHLSGSRLQHAGDGRLDGLADHLARVVDNHHRAIV